MSQNFKETITTQQWKETSTKAAKVTCNLKENWYKMFYRWNNKQ